MAAASADKNPWEETICSICLDYFKDPVTLECGHNFCGTCLTQCWKKSADTDESCPFCRAKVLQKNLIKNGQLANVALNLHPSYEGEKGGKQEPQKNDYEDDETISVEFDRSKEHYDYRVISLGKAVQDCKNQEEAKMEKSLGEITQDCWFMEDQNNHLWAQIEEMEHQIERKTNYHNPSSLANVLLRMQDELLLARNRLLQKSEKKETFKKPGTFFSGLKWKNQEFSDQKSDQHPFMNLVQAFFPSVKCFILESNSACSFLTQSDGRKSVKHGTEPQDLCDNPKKFNNPMYVFRRKGLPTNVYAERFVKGREGIWPVEVATKSVRGKGHVPKELIWAMGKWIGGCPDTSLPCCSVLSLSEKTKEVQGYLNNAAGQVGFFDGEMGAQIEAILEVPVSGVSVQPFFYV